MSNPATAPANTNEPHGFYPAITHFTDAITALPREYRRHTSLLKEVDAKAWAPEENLQALLTACIASRPARETSANLQYGDEGFASTLEPQNQQIAADSATSAVADNASQHSAASVDPVTRQRRRLFYDLRYNLTEMMVTMDEKNHVINNANEELSRHLRRLETIFPHIASEVSEEARLGSLTHWAYLENRAPTRGTGHTSRRDAAASLATMHETDIASRSESRREAMLARKQRQTHVDSDFDEQRNSNRRTNGNGKTRRIGEITAEAAGLGISNAASAPKRKKAEKLAAGSLAAEVASARSNAGGVSMSREPSQQDGATKKRKAPTSSIHTARKRYEYSLLCNYPTNDVFCRIATTVSAANSPALISSPTSGAFGKDTHRGSPALSATRPQSSRARQNSSQKVEGVRARPDSSASHKNISNGNTVTASTPELQNMAALAGRSAAEGKNTMKESTNQRGDRLVEEDDTTANGTNGESVRGGILLEHSSSKVGGLKREADTSEENLIKNGASPRLSQSLLTTDRAERPSRGRSSKTATPVVGSFADALENIDVDRANGLKSKRTQPRSRMKDQLQDSLSPTGLPVKRSHKKGAGLAAQAAAMQAKRLTKDPAEDAASSMADGEQEDEDEEANGEEAIYCYCQSISYGEMVACDAENCPREWFHLECVGLEKAPGKNSKSKIAFVSSSRPNTDILT